MRFQSGAAEPPSLSVDSSSLVPEVPSQCDWDSEVPRDLGVYPKRSATVPIPKRPMKRDWDARIAVTWGDGRASRIPPTVPTKKQKS